MAITDTQRRILREAARRPDGVLLQPENLPPAPRLAVARALLDAGLAEADPARDTADPASAWKIDGDLRALRITATGREAVGIGQPEEEASGPDPAAQAAFKVGGGELPASEIEAAQPAHTPPPEAAPKSASDRHSLRDVAAAVIAAWDQGGTDRTGLSSAIERLRSTLLKPARPPSAPGARAPRSGTKQEQVLKLLRRREGATITQIAQLTNWQTHTVRGFLAGLKKRGVEVSVLERVRQVGPGQQGARGSYSVYHLAATS